MEREIIKAWEAMTGTEQYDMIAACVFRAAKKEYGAEILYRRGHSADEYISEAWLKLTETMTPGHVAAINAKRRQAGKQPITLVSMVYNAVRASIAAVVRADWQADNRDGGELEPERHSARDCTEAVIVAVDLERFMAGRDARDQRIMAMTLEGYTTREAGRAEGISGVAVTKRLSKMRQLMEV